MKQFQVILWFNGSEEPAVQVTVKAKSPEKAMSEAMRDTVFVVNSGALANATDFVFRSDVTYVRVIEITSEQVAA